MSKITIKYYRLPACIKRARKIKQKRDKNRSDELKKEIKGLISARKKASKKATR